MKLPVLPFLALLLLLFCCSDENGSPVEKPIEYGNDGAVLTKIDLDGAVGLVAVYDPERVYDYSPAWSFHHETLKKINPDGTLAEASFGIEGEPNGGFDNYLVNNISDRYFLISFYLRKESYIVDKHNGLAAKTHFTPASQLSSATVNNKWFYKDNVSYTLCRVDNFLLSTDAVLTERAVDSYTTDLYVDGHEELYIKSQDHLLYIDKDLGSITGFTDQSVAVWHDRNHTLKTVSRNGKIYTLSTTAATYLQYEKDFGMPVTTWSNPIPFEFPSQNKQFLLFTDAASGVTHLFDLVKNESAVDLTDENTVFTTYGSAIYDQTIFLFQSDSRTQRLVTIDSNDLTVQKVDVNVTSNEYGKLHALTSGLSVVEACENATVCSLKTIDAAGTVADLSGQPIRGTVIKL
ncbi:hypothetical protein [Dawidia soli]|uniref:Lipoprotein n=1 Tax=Dawidia soli TaxID=2782352 RepID=A0AAP2DDV2_9BACT|nr:hypothetical protein [Dawidia soli]MBT1690361.1 hypothetical protein [Dawidia soli]